MVIKRRDFQKAAAFIHEFLLKLSEDVECAELRDTLNLALLHMQKYYRLLQSRSQEKNAHNTLSLSARGLSPLTPFVDAPDKFRWRWLNLDNARMPSNMSVSDSINLTILPPMIRAVKAGNLKVMQELIRQNPRVVNDHDGIGRTALMYAVHHTEHKALSYLLENMADINITAHDGSTALHCACHEGSEVAVSLLIDYGADMTVRDTFGRAPIHWAVTTSATECLELLLENQADPSMRDKDGLTPCMWACRMDNIQHFELLCRSNYIVHEHDGIERDVNGRTWMHWAVRRTEPLECLQTLLTPQSASYKDEDGKTVLMVAAEMGSLLATRLIVEIAGIATLDDYDMESRTALHLATIGGHGDVVNYLLEQGADMNRPDQFNATVWDYARTKQLHYCQLIIMSHQRQRMMSNPMSPVPSGLGLLMNSEGSVQEGFSRMSFRTRSGQSTPITPPHPPKRPRTNRVLQRRSNSLTTSPHHDSRHQDQRGGRKTNSAGQERKKDRLEMTVNTRATANSTSFLSTSRQDTAMTDDVDIMNVMNDVEINGEDDIDNVSMGGMDVSDIEDPEQFPDYSMYMDPHQLAAAMARPVPVQRPPKQAKQPQQEQPARQQQQQPPTKRQQQQARRQQREQPAPPDVQFQPVPPSTAPSSHVLQRSKSQEDTSGKVANNKSGAQPSGLQPSSPSKAFLSPQPPARPSLRSSQQPQRSPGRGGPVPSPPNTDPQRPHMIRQHYPLPPQTAQKTSTSTAADRGDRSQSDPICSPTSSVNSPDQTSGGMHVSVGVGPSGKATSGGAAAHAESNRPNSGGRAKSPGVAIEGRKIPPPMLTPLPNAPIPPVPDIFASGEDGAKGRKKKKKKKGRVVTQEKDKESRSPPQNPPEIPQPRGYAAPLHPQHGRERGHSAASMGPKYSKGYPQHSESRSVQEHTGSHEPPAISGFAVPIREGTARSSRPSQHSVNMETEDPMGPGGDAEFSASHPAEGIREVIVEEDEFGELIGTRIPPAHGSRGSTHHGGRPLSQSMPQDKTSLKMTATSAKPPLPHSNRHSAPRRSSEKDASPRRRSRPPTSRS